MSYTLNLNAILQFLIVVVIFEVYCECHMNLCNVSCRDIYGISSADYMDSIRSFLFSSTLWLMLFAVFLDQHSFANSQHYTQVHISLKKSSTDYSLLLSMNTLYGHRTSLLCFTFTELIYKRHLIFNRTVFFFSAGFLCKIRKYLIKVTDVLSNVFGFCLIRFHTQESMATLFASRFSSIRKTRLWWSTLTQSRPRMVVLTTQPVFS